MAQRRKYAAAVAGILTVEDITSLANARKCGQSHGATATQVVRAEIIWQDDEQQYRRCIRWRPQVVLSSGMSDNPRYNSLWLKTMLLPALKPVESQEVGLDDAHHWLDNKHRLQPKAAWPNDTSWTVWNRNYRNTTRTITNMNFCNHKPLNNIWPSII